MADGIEKSISRAVNGGFLKDIEQQIGIKHYAQSEIEKIHSSAGWSYYKLLFRNCHSDLEMDVAYGIALEVADNAMYQWAHRITKGLSHDRLYYNIRKRNTDGAPILIQDAMTSTCHLEIVHLIMETVLGGNKSQPLKHEWITSAYEVYRNLCTVVTSGYQKLCLLDVYSDKSLFPMWLENPKNTYLDMVIHECRMRNSSRTKKDILVANVLL